MIQSAPPMGSTLFLVASISNTSLRSASFAGTLHVCHQPLHWMSAFDAKRTYSTQDVKQYIQGVMLLVPNRTLSQLDHLDRIPQRIFRYIAIERRCADVLMPHKFLDCSHPDALCIQSRRKCPAS
jgi:hypothetical protein